MVLPGRNNPVTPIDLVLLRRLADRERLDIGLVTADKSISRQARAVGLPVFSNVTLAEYYRPGWWRAGRRTERLGFGPGADRRSPEQIAAENALSSSRWRAYRPLLAVLLAAIILLSLPFALSVFFLPLGTITLQTETLPAQVILDLSTDAELSAVSGDAVLGHPVQHAQSWEAVGETTDDAAADQQRIRAQALQGLGAAAPDILAGRLVPGLMLVPASVHVAVLDETFTPGADNSRVVLQTTLSGTAVAEADLNRIAYAALAAALPDGFVPDVAGLGVTMATAPTADPDQFQITARATARPLVDTGSLAQALAGRRAADAATYLSATLPLSAPPDFDVAPGWWWSWFGRLPLRAERIEVEVRP